MGLILVLNASLTNFFVFDDLLHVFYTVVAIWMHGYFDFTVSQN